MSGMKKQNGKFTVTEVGTLIEAMRTEFKPILEDIPHIKSKLDATFEQVGKNTEEIQINRHLINRVLAELKSKVDRKEFETLEKRVASITG